MRGNHYVTTGVPRLQPCDGVRCDVARIVTVITADRQLQQLLRVFDNVDIELRCIVFTIFGESLYY